MQQTSPQIPTESPEAVLKRYFGYSSFRKGQREIIETTLAGRDSLVLMPTGGGKSICFQVPALMMPGCAIVVSPLIALMNDQVLGLCANGIPAGALHSNLDEGINRMNLDKAARGEIKLLYISPERLTADIDIISGNLDLSLVAIDEAHCISQWGHDFRPVYTSLKCIKEKFPKSPVMALTATADRLTRNDIAESLSLNNPFRWIGSFDRPNISLRVMNDPGKARRLEIIASLINKYSLDSGIVYCLSRKKTEEMHTALLSMGFRSVCYHAGMPPSEREKSQKAFVNGDAQVVCATIAFGMGIDKSNIRWVVHNNIPGNIESYYQEIGRAGRDGLPAEALMFYNFGDILMRRSFANESGRQEINNEKLDFMQRFAEATICRRRILLSYFSEETNHDCCNCDNCRSPRQKIDGTILAQKVISAIIRINSSEAINMVIDILRGSNRQEIIRKGYDKIKTYGVGADLSSREWNSYILQMIQLGLLEVLYEDNFHVRPTAYGMKVVKGLERISLSRYEEPVFGTKKKKIRNIVAEPEPELTPDEKLLIALKKLRTEIAAKDNIAAYMVFSDATLAEIVEKKPADIENFHKISGVGQVKLAKYGKPFILAVRKHIGLKKVLPVGTSQKETLILFDAGKTPEEIAELKGVSLVTVYSHFAQWADEDKLTDFRRLLTTSQYELVTKILAENPEEAYTILRDEYKVPSHIINIARAEERWRQRHQ